MPYASIRFDVDAARAERWSDALADAGALSVDLSDPAAGTPGESPVFGEPGEEAPTLWPLTRIDALVDAAVDADALVARVAAAIGESLPAFEVREVADTDWVRATQSQFGPIRIADDFWIVPSWCEPPDPRARVVTLDPGLAFGTGTHPTTRLCLEWLVETVAGGERVLDYGCGSGILAIAAAKLGAGEVVGTDVDAQAIGASQANALANRVPARFVEPGALGSYRADVVVANILANPLVVLAPALAARTRVGGRIALSGILAAQEESVACAYARWFTLDAARRADGWVLVTGVRAGDASA
ncbi:MAG: 50S ribosomal protein L11 methyltransferase [Burkholderiales bacterium]